MSVDIVFCAAKRTPFGAFGGSLKDRTATDLAVHAATAAFESAKISPAAIDHVLFGNVQQTAADASYLARHVGLRSSVPVATPAVTVNRLCGSGFESIIQGARLLRSGEATAVLAGGAESMSQAPYTLRGARFGVKFGNQEWEDTLMSGLYDPFPKLPMALTAENLAVQYGISRQQSDAFALRSQQNAARAQSENLFADEIAPLEIQKKGQTISLDRDEHPRPSTDLETLAKLKPVFKKDGVVTAGNASGMVDGAAAVILTTRENAKKHGWPILGEYLGSHTVGCDPAIMGIGPVAACRGLLEKTKTKQEDISLIEVNEAFAPQVLAVEHELGFGLDRLNVDGGAIAIGHPLGATGTRLTMHILYALKRRGGGLGIASACIGGGQGIAVLLRV